MSYGKILSIQSHVVHGHVGNKAAVFPLQLLGFDVDFINSVQFSNHTHYKHCMGQRLNAHELSDLFEGLRLNSLMDYSHLLTGYVGDVTFLNKMADLIDELKEKNPNLIYLCDPVMGDNGKLYVPQELVSVYLNRILPKANIITPNLFELEIIYGEKITSKQCIYKAIDHCHKIGIQTVIVSSSKNFTDPEFSVSPKYSRKPEKLVLYASNIDSDHTFEIEFERIAGTFYGSGDAFSAIIFAWLTRLDNDLKGACEHAISSMLHILNRTIESRQDEDEMIEIKLVQSKTDIEEPEIAVKALKVPRK